MATAAPKAFKKVIHAYRRVPLMVPARNGIGEEEKPVEVVYEGVKLVFRGNDQGHVVAECAHAHVFQRLVKEIPEAYIEYTGNDIEFSNVVGGPQAKKKPVGDFVLESGDEFAVLDDMDDDELRAFAASAGLEAFPDAIAGDDLRRAIFNSLGGK